MPQAYSCRAVVAGLKRIGVGILVDVDADDLIDVLGAVHDVPLHVVGAVADLDDLLP